MTSEFFEHSVEVCERIFWPKFTEHEGCVFLFFDETKYRQWWQVTNGDKKKIESIINHRHILDLLPKSIESPKRDLVIRFGELLRDVWDAKLHRDYPARHFIVSFECGDSKTFEDYEITFYQTSGDS